MSTEQILENQEPQEPQEVEVQAAPEGEQPVPEPDEEKKVPLAALRESRAKLKAEREQREALQMRVAQMEGYLASLQNQNAQPKAAPRNVDPEVYELIKPILEEYMTPAQAKLAALEGALLQERNLRTFEQKKSFVLQEIPFLDEIRDDLREEIEAMSDEEREVFENSPRALIRLAKAIHASKSPSKATDQSKAIAKASAKGVSGSAPASRHTSPGPVDVSSMSNEEFRKRFPGFA